MTADGWKLRGVSALACFLMELGQLKKEVLEGSTVARRWGRADCLKKRDQAGAEDAAVALAATIRVLGLSCHRLVT